MPLTRLSRDSVLRAAGVVVITAAVSIAAACSNEDTVDTVPPPWPTPTVAGLEGPVVPDEGGAPAPTPATTGAATGTNTGAPAATSRPRTRS
ncbi:hypothetical protein [Intrasporangium sp.]|uniref:hypothetical protein n=1 Tax=Intrasporangium sp. TaxID=1925024 RepID=UPI0032219F7A